MANHFVNSPEEAPEAPTPKVSQEAGFPTCRYRINKGKIEDRMFDSNSIPEGKGWKDTPAGMAEEIEKKAAKAGKNGKGE